MVLNQPHAFEILSLNDLKCLVIRLSTNIQSARLVNFLLQALKPIYTCETLASNLTALGVLLQLGKPIHRARLTFLLVPCP